MSDSDLFQRTVDTLAAALDYAFNQGLQGRPKPDRPDAERLTWQLVDLAMDGVRRDNRS